MQAGYNWSSKLNEVRAALFCDLNAWIELAFENATGAGIVMTL
jgi:hypothetical protein